MKGRLGSFLMAIVGLSGYDIFHNIAGGRISPIIGAAIVGATEIILSSFAIFFFYILRKNIPADLFSVTFGGVLACIGIGVFAWLIDVGQLDIYKFKEIFHLSRIAPLLLICSVILTFAWGILINKEILDWEKIIGIASGCVCLYFLTPKS